MFDPAQTSKRVERFWGVTCANEIQRWRGLAATSPAESLAARLEARRRLYES